MVAHVHAALMAEYAKDALKTDKPWERWEFDVGNGWMSYTAAGPSWRPTVRYRRKPVEVIRYVQLKVDFFLEIRNSHLGHQTPAPDDNLKVTILDGKIVKVDVL